MKRLTLRCGPLAGQLAFLLVTVGLAGRSRAADLPAFTAGKSTVTFTALPKQAEPDELKWRLHSVESPAPLDLAKEKF